MCYNNKQHTTHHPGCAATSSSHLTDASPQVLVTCRHDVALVLPHTLAQAVVSVRAFVGAGDALDAGVLQAAQRQRREGNEQWQQTCERRQIHARGPSHYSYKADACCALRSTCVHRMLLQLSPTRCKSECAVALAAVRSSPSGASSRCSSSVDEQQTMVASHCLAPLPP